MTDLLSGEEFWELFQGFEHTAFRLEVRERYEDEEEREPLRRFLAGEPADDSWFMDFVEVVRSWISTGKRMERVRVVTEPLGDYARFLVDLARLNTAAGEDIRYLPHHQAAELDLPDHDFWLFDSSKVAILRFDDEDRMLGSELVTDPADVVRHCYWRDVAWHYAVPYARYASG